MSKIKNNIGWCDATGNPGIGCRGCELGDDCYAKFDTPARVLRAGRWPGHVGDKIETFGAGRLFVPTKTGLSDLRRLNKMCVCDQCHSPWPIEKMATDYCHAPDGRGLCKGELRRIRFFADSNSDWMDWPIGTLVSALDEIRLAPNVDVILLTKWPELFYERMDMALNHVCQHYSKTDANLVDWIFEWTDSNLSRPNPWVPKNIWVLTSVLGNALDERRVANVMNIPAAVRGLSCEPLWAFPKLPTRLGISNIDWIIIGCDSSKHRRGWEAYETNVRSLISIAKGAGIQVYHKQMSVAGRASLKMAEWPPEFQVREFPTTKKSKIQPGGSR
jgi:protein gp37